MNDNSSGGKISFVWFHFVNAKENLAHLTKKNWRPGAKINTIYRLSYVIS